MKNIRKYVKQASLREQWWMLKQMKAKQIPVNNNEKCEACECTPCDCGWGNYLAKAGRKQNETH